MSPVPAGTLSIVRTLSSAQGSVGMEDLFFYFLNLGDWRLESAQCPAVRPPISGFDSWQQEYLLPPLPSNPLIGQHCRVTTLAFNFQSGLNCR